MWADPVCHGAGGMELVTARDDGPNTTRNPASGDIGAWRIPPAFQALERSPPAVTPTPAATAPVPPRLRTGINGVLNREDRHVNAMSGSHQPAVNPATVPVLRQAPKPTATPQPRIALKNELVSIAPRSKPQPANAPRRSAH